MGESQGKEGRFSHCPQENYARFRTQAYCGSSKRALGKVAEGTKSLKASPPGFLRGWSGRSRAKRLTNPLCGSSSVHPVSRLPRKRDPKRNPIRFLVDYMPVQEENAPQITPRLARSPYPQRNYCLIDGAEMIDESKMRDMAAKIRAKVAEMKKDLAAKATQIQEIERGLLALEEKIKKAMQKP
jgi:hypothetical protein